MCDHDGRCAGRLGLVDGRLVREVVCDDCGTVTHELEPEQHELSPDLRLATEIAGYQARIG